MHDNATEIFLFITCLMGICLVIITIVNFVELRAILEKQEKEAKRRIEMKTLNIIRENTPMKEGQIKSDVDAFIRRWKP